MMVKKAVIIFISIVLIFLFLQLAYSGYFLFLGKQLTKTEFKDEIVLGDSSKPVYRFFVTGDSLAAGVGASSFEKSVSGRTAVYLSSTHKVVFTSEAKSGSRMADMLDAPVPSVKQDLIVMIVSSNDLFHFSSLPEFGKNTARVFEKYSTKADKIIVVGPGRLFDAKSIPLVIKPIYKIQSNKYAKILATEAGKYKNIVYINPLDPPKGVSDVKDWAARDNFHPGDNGYVFWFEMVKTAL